MLKTGIIVISTLIVAFILLNLFSIFKTDLNKPKVEEQTEIESETEITEQPETEAEDVEELLIEVLEAGEGDEVKNGDTLSVHYKGSLLDGTVFDQSGEKPFSFKIGEASVIQGWEQGLLGMQVGEKRLLTIPSEMAYGPVGSPPAIPGGAALQFEVELVDIQK